MTAQPLQVLVAAIRVLPEPALLVHGDGEVVAANASARAALALDFERPEGVNLLDIIVSPREILSTYLRICARSLSPMPGAFSVHRRTSLPTDHLCKGCIVMQGGPEMRSLVMLRLSNKEEGNVFILLNQKVAALTREVLRRRATEEALRESERLLRERAREAENLNRVKDEFVATLSHELRTPLNAVIGWATLLRQHRVSEDRRAHVIETIERNAKAQARLVEELLDISHIVAGKMRLHVQPLDPRGPIEAAVESLRPAALAKCLEMRTILDPLASPIMADPDRVQQICGNLLANAIKFTPKGGRVELRLECAGPNVALTVSDTGQGIDAEFLARVFDRFLQKDSSTTRRAGGLGLGLSIVKSLVELHGGAVRADSDGEGKGATFVVELPRASQLSEFQHRERTTA
jgi:signal transduction histidine kinase